MSGLWRNGAALAIGRIALSAARMLAALAVARLAGAERFGEYALLLSLIGLAEWLVDFGQTDIAVRDMARRPQRRAGLLHALALAKRTQGAAVAIALPLLLWAIGMERMIVLAGCAGSVAIGATAWMQPARAALRAALKMDRDIGAELAGVAVMLPSLTAACMGDAPLPLLVASFAAGRVVQAGLTRWMAGRDEALVDPRCTVRRLVRQAVPLGMAGLLVLLYDALAPLLLARLSDMRAVALYAAAARYIFPVLVAVQAINGAFLPVLAGQWRRDAAALARTQQTALLTAAAVAAPLFAAIHGGAAFLMGLLGPDFLAGAGLLQLMAWLLPARAVTTAMSPLIVIAGQAGRGMLLTALSLGAQVAALLLLVPRHGVMGAGIGYLAVELLLGTVAVSWMGQRTTKIAIDWRPVAALIAVAAGAALLVDASPLAGQWGGGALAALTVIGAMAWLGRARIAPLHVWRRASAGGAA